MVSRYCRNGSKAAGHLPAAKSHLLWIVAVVLLSGASPGWLLAAPVEVPVINGDLGPCSAAFTVVNASNHPIYNAKIDVTIRYGFMNMRKTDLEIGTNSDGKARFEGLPDRLKKPPMVFTIRSGDQTKSVTNDPATNCHADFPVTLGAP